MESVEEAAGGREGPSRPDWATVPNVITTARLVLFLPIVVGTIASRQYPMAATVLLVVYASTDWVDGFLARRLNQVSRIGELIDPLADRAGEMCIYATMLAVGLLPWWVVAVIVGVDIGLFAVVATRMHAIRDVSVTWVGKARTAVVAVALPLLTLSQAEGMAGPTLAGVAMALLVIGCLLHVIAGLLYGVGLVRHVGAEQPAASTSEG
jgi:cardiolipin synthase (CMP-forming)